MNSIKKQNSWIEHVKAYQAENKCTYAQALKEAKATYKKSAKKETSVTVDPVAPVEVEDVKIEESPIKKKRAYRRKTKVDKSTQTE